VYLDFYSSIKLVNYIRSEVLKGNFKPDVSSKSLFDDEHYLQPALEDDALLFCLDDLPAPSKAADGADPTAQRMSELEQELSALRLQFADYRSAVEKTLDDRWTEGTGQGSGPSRPGPATNGQGDESRDEKIDQGYFDSYSYNDIHQIMLQDTVRTDSYRDFIYSNKDVFQGKTVLDVGCGTGILSLFCAKAGAARVISVDNSAIIEKAKANIAANGLSDRITCVRGKIEEIDLPDGIEHVDIIVSEWMGYCLLYEAMLDSVLYARDKWLRPNGLMVPSHVTIQLAPLEDPEYVSDNVTFWRDVYGFDMAAMMEKMYDDVLVRYPRKEVIAGRTQNSMPIKVFDLHTVTTKQLQFEEPFSITIHKDVEEIDSWCTWFDTIFLKSRDHKVPEYMLQGEKSKVEDGSVIFTTGPYGPETHWRCGMCMVDHSEKPGVPLKAGQSVEGRVAFKKNKDEKRALNIDIIWEAKGTEEKGRQRWFMK